MTVQLFSRDEAGWRLELLPPGSVQLIGLRYDQGLIDLVLERKDKGKTTKLGRLKPISDYNVNTTRERYPNCECERYGLYKGMTLHALLKLNGCQNNWVCSRLDALRRLEGH